MNTAILITQCLQNDFVQPIGKYDPMPNSLHVGYSEAQRLLGERAEEGPVQTVMEWAYSLSPEELELIHIRDWHEKSKADQKEHLATFGDHCLAGTPGAEFVFSSAIKAQRPHHVINASGLNDFLHTGLQEVLDRLKDQEDVKVGLMGVWTEAKIFFLAYDLRTRYPQFDIAICSALCASSSRQMHFIAMDQMKNLLGVKVFASVGDFTSFLAGSLPSIRVPKSDRLDPSKLHFVNPYNMQPMDQQMVLYLFRDCQEVELKGLDGGFSGNVVLKARSKDNWGHQQVPCVVKIGRRDLIAKERISFEKIQEVLGNNAPGITDFAELGDRGAIKYRYAAMLEGPVSCFQDVYEAGAPISQLELVLDRVFLQQLGRLYEAESFEKLNLFTYYDFKPKYAPHVEANVRSILGLGAEDSLNTVIVPGFTAGDMVKFYSSDVTTIAAHSDRMHYCAYVHGDLNGKSILVDSQGNVWIIDFFSCDRGHVLRDLVKLENDLLYIFTKLSSPQELEEGKKLVEMILSQGDLASVPDPQRSSSFQFPQMKRAWETLCLLRSYYPELIKLDRSPHQVHIAMLRYAAHTLSFDECSNLQKKWALYTCARCIQEILRTHTGTRTLKIDFLPSFEGGGQIGLTILPGRKDRSRDLAADLDQIKKDGITAVVCLLTENEFEKYGVPDLRNDYRRAGLNYYSFPIMDQGIPAKDQLSPALDWIDAKVQGGAKVLIHCVGGLGRSGLAAAAYLVKKRGFSPEKAIAEVRQCRGERAIETQIQEEFILELR